MPKVVNVVGLGDYDPMILAFDLAPIYLAGKGCDVSVGHVISGIKEVLLDGELFIVRDNIQRLELLDHCPNVLVFVTNIVFF